MLFEPPFIQSIKDVLPFVEANPAFVVKEKGWYTVVDYMYMTDKLFEHPIERECRGLKFDTKTGGLLARPYHKFHNLNERPAYATDKVDLTLPHVILDKLDGSMVHTCVSPMGVYLMTRMGITEVAEKADAFMVAHEYRYAGLLNTLPLDEYTYIFEYVGPGNKIVLDYKREDLILTAIRHNLTGSYVQYKELQALAKAFGVTVVQAFPFEGFNNDMGKIANAISEQKNTEGYVVRFISGSMIKIKADEYVRKHRTKELVSSEKGIISLIVENNLDDVLPQLDEPVRLKVQEYAERINNLIDDLSAAIDGMVKMKADETQKDFALWVQANISKVTQCVWFNTRKTGNPREELLNLFRRNCGTNKRIGELLDNLHFPRWSFSFFAEE